MKNKSINLIDYAPDKTSMSSFRLSDALKARAIKVAEESGSNLTQLIHSALKMYCDLYEAEKKKK